MVGLANTVVWPALAFLVVPLSVWTLGLGAIALDALFTFVLLDLPGGDVMVSNHPKCAARIDKAHSDGNGLLAHNGSSYEIPFSGDAERAVLTTSGAGRRKEGRTGPGYPPT